MDGSSTAPGAPTFVADVGILEDRIQAVGELNDVPAARTIDVSGLAVAPGFIDVHTHSEDELRTNPRAESKIRQGVTTEILGLDGGSFDPRELGEGLEELVRAGVAVNIASLVGQGKIRGLAMGMTDRDASADEIDAMRRLAQVALQQGALGISSGLEYTPGGFASTEELTALCSSMSGTPGVYATHLRNEDDRVAEAVAEAIAIAEGAGTGLHISHLKCQGERNWRKRDRIFTLIEAAETRGVSVTMDRYPYVAYATGLSSLMPLWSRAGGTETFLARLQDPAAWPRIREAVEEKVALLGSWEAVLITSVTRDENKRFEGRTIAAIVESEASDAAVFCRNLIVEENNRVQMVGFGMNEENTTRILAHPNCMPASDGSALADYGALKKGNPHPRSYGTFPRVLARYVREREAMTLEEAIRKMTRLPAERFGLAGRGRIAEGFFADLVAFDPGAVEDKATYDDPHRYAVGIDYVLVNGQVVLKGTEHSGALPGMALRRPAA